MDEEAKNSITGEIAIQHSSCFLLMSQWYMVNNQEKWGNCAKSCLINKLYSCHTNIHFSNYPQRVASSQEQLGGYILFSFFDWLTYVKVRLCTIKTDTSFIPIEAICHTNMQLTHEYPSAPKLPSKQLHIDSNASPGCQQLVFYCAIRVVWHLSNVCLRNLKSVVITWRYIKYPLYLFIHLYIISKFPL